MRRAAPPSSGHASRRHAAEVAAAADVTITMLADDDAVRRRLRAGRTASSPARTPGSVLVDTQHGPAGHASGRSRPTSRATRRGDPRCAGVGQRHAWPRSGQLTLMVGGDAGGPRAGAAGPRAAREAIFHLGPLGYRCGDEARRQHGDLRAQPGASRRGSCSPSAAGDRPRASPTTSSPRARSARRTSATSARPSSSPTRRRSRSPLDLAAKDLRPDPDRSPTTSGSTCRSRKVNLDVIRSAASAGAAASRTSRRSRRTCAIARRSAGAARRPIDGDRIDPNATNEPTSDEAPKEEHDVADRTLIRDGIVLTQDADARRAAERRRPHRGRHDRRGRAEPVGRGRRGHRRRRATSSSRASSTPTATRGRRRSGRAPRTTRWAPTSAAILDKFAPHYRPDDVYAANLWGALECVNAGITTLVDWSHIMNTPDHADAAIRGPPGVRHPVGLRLRLPEHVAPGLVVRPRLRRQRPRDRRRPRPPHPESSTSTPTTA